MLSHARTMDRKILALEATRDLTKIWAHVDMDAFYAAAEELANPSLVCHFLWQNASSLLMTCTCLCLVSCYSCYPHRSGMWPGSVITIS